LFWITYNDIAIIVVDKKNIVNEKKVTLWYMVTIFLFKVHVAFISKPFFVYKQKKKKLSQVNYLWRKYFHKIYIMIRCHVNMIIGVL